MISTVTPSGDSADRATSVLSGLAFDAAGRIDALRSSIHLELRSAYWFGPLADEVRASWEAGVGPAMVDVAERLRALSRHLMALETGVVQPPN